MLKKNEKGQFVKGSIYSHWKGKKMSEQHRKKLGRPNKHGLGYKHTSQAKFKIREYQQKLVMEGKHHLWKGGITPINAKIRSSLEYKLWRESVFKRDNYQCIWGGKEHGNKLNADHIKPFAYFPELRFAIDNGRTLCEDCHKTTDTYKQKI